MDYDLEVEKAIGRSSKCFPVLVKISTPPEERREMSENFNVCYEENDK